MKYLLILLLLSGCANRYQITRCVEANVCTTVKVVSYYNHPKGINTSYKVTNEDGLTKEFRFESGEAVKQEVPVKDIVNGAKTLLKLFPIN